MLWFAVENRESIMSNFDLTKLVSTRRRIYDNPQRPLITGEEWARDTLRR